MRTGPEPYVVEDEDTVSLHFGPLHVQSRMSRHFPDNLAVPYTRSMMAVLLLHPDPRKLAFIGLGGGSLVKYCLARLPESTLTVVEISPAVIALRDRFSIPPDGPRLQVLQMDGARFVSGPSGSYDALFVDGFDAEGLAEGLSSVGFYADCERQLAEGGVLSVNLHADSTGYGKAIRRLRAAFGPRLAVLLSEDGQNKVVLAVRGELPTPAELRERTMALQDRHALDLREMASQIVANLERTQGAG